MWLQETALLTGIIARSMSADTFDSSGATSASDLELASHATRVQRLMLALIPHYDPTDDLIRILRHVLLNRRFKKPSFTCSVFIDTSVTVTVFAVPKL